MTITTNRNQTYTVDWIDSLLTDPKKLLMQMEDARPIAQIVPDFDGLTRIDRVSETQGDKTYEGYTSLTGISRKNDGKILITMERAASTE